MATTTLPTEQRIVLHDVSWDTYERILADHLDSSAPRFTYDRGELEILSPSTEHEEDNRTLALLVEDVSMELEIETRNVGSMTFKRRDLMQGFEPDSSFYIQHVDDVRGAKQIDLSVDPPPDLIIEIEVTHPALPKMQIYADMGIREVWRSNGSRVTIAHLVGVEYRETAVSLALPPLTSRLLTGFLMDSRALTRLEWRRRVREWAQRQRQEI